MCMEISEMFKNHITVIEKNYHDTYWYWIIVQPYAEHKRRYFEDCG